MTNETAAARPPSAQLLSELADFEDWLVGLNFSDHTIVARVRAVTAFVSEWQTWEPRPSLVTTTLRRYDGWTARTYFNHMRSAFVWAVETGRAQTDPTARMKRPTAPTPTPKPLPSLKLREALDTAHGRRLAYMLLAYYAGLRAHEIAKFRGESIAETHLRVSGKGGKTAEIPTHPVLWALAQQYPRRGYWFPSPQLDGPIQAGAVSESVRVHLRALGVEQGGIHRLRASYGTDLLRAGTNIRVVQRLMRLSSLATAEHYLAVTEDEERVGILGLVA